MTSDDTSPRDPRHFPEPEDLAIPAASFSPDADAERTPKLASAMREHFRLQLLGALRHAGDALGGLRRLQERWADLDANLAFGPAVFAAYGTLMDAMRRGSPEAVVDACQGLWTLGDDAIHDARFRAGSILEEPWEAPIVHLMRREPREDGAPGPVAVQPLLDRDLSALGTAFQRARALIAAADPDLDVEIETHVTRLKWFAGHGIDGAASPRGFGVVFLRIPLKEEPVGFILARYVREATAFFLQTLRAHDPLLVNAAESAGTVPAGPLASVLNAAVGDYRAGRVLDHAARFHPGIDLGNARERVAASLERALGVLRAQAVFTPAGARLAAGLGIDARRQKS